MDNPHDTHTLIPELIRVRTKTLTKFESMGVNTVRIQDGENGNVPCNE